MGAWEHGRGGAWAREDGEDEDEDEGDDDEEIARHL